MAQIWKARYASLDNDYSVSACLFALRIHRDWLYKDYWSSPNDY